MSNVNCIAVLPGAIEPNVAHALGFDPLGTSIKQFACTTKDGKGAEVPDQTDALVVPMKQLARLFNPSRAGKSQTSALEARLMTVLLPAGQFDDDVWTPIISQIITARAKLDGSRQTVFAWTGLEPYLLPYGDAGAAELIGNPALSAILLPVLDRSAASLTQLLRQTSDETVAADIISPFRIASVSAANTEDDSATLVLNMW